MLSTIQCKKPPEVVAGDMSQRLLDSATTEHSRGAHTYLHADKMLRNQTLVKEEPLWILLMSMICLRLLSLRYRMAATDLSIVSMTFTVWKSHVIQASQCCPSLLLGMTPAPPKGQSTTIAVGSGTRCRGSICRANPLLHPWVPKYSSWAHVDHTVLSADGCRLLP